jgi:hypothetical protein
VSRRGGTPGRTRRLCAQTACAPADTRKGEAAGTQNRCGVRCAGACRGAAGPGARRPRLLPRDQVPEKHIAVLGAAGDVGVAVRHTALNPVRRVLVPSVAREQLAARLVEEAHLAVHARGEHAVPVVGVRHTRDRVADAVRHNLRPRTSAYLRSGLHLGRAKACRSGQGRASPARTSKVRMYPSTLAAQSWCPRTAIDVTLSRKSDIVCTGSNERDLRARTGAQRTRGGRRWRRRQRRRRRQLRSMLWRAPAVEYPHSLVVAARDDHG